MRSLTFWKRVGGDRTDEIERIFEALRGSGVPFCVVGAVAANAYAEPLISQDIEIAVANGDAARAEAVLAEALADGRSKLSVEIHSDSRYATFLDRVQERDVLGLTLPVASAEDVLQGLVWLASSPTRRGVLRQKDLVDIARMIEALPRLRSRVPPEILSRFF